ncbi:sensor histidine kinase [Paenibacillus thalictri]|nr:sensor histidine kinase [Paenibacillus thalictri]
MRIIRFLFVSFCVLSLIYGVASANARSEGEIPELVTSDSKLMYSMNTHMSILADPDRQWSLDDVQSQVLQERFRPATGQSSFGFGSPVYWVKMQIRNGSSKPNWEIGLQNPLLDKAELFAPVSVEPLNRNYPAFALNLPSGQLTTIYMRLETSGSMIVPLSLTEPSATYDAIHLEFLLYGLYYGMIVIIIVYMYTLYRSIRNSAYLYYIFYIASYSASQFIWNGLARQFMGPDLLMADSRGIYWFNGPSSAYDFFFLLSLWFGFMAIRKMLEPDKYAPLAGRVCRLMLVLCPISVLCALMVYSGGIPYYLSWFKSAGILIVPSVIIACAVKGNRLAWYVSGSILPLFIIGGPSNLLSFGLVPDNVFTHFGMQFGSAAEFLTMAVLLYEQISKMRKTQDEAKQQLMNALTDWNEALNKTVAEQTENLRRTNGELVIVEAARTMLLQNISHDVRNPLNFVQGGILALKYKLAAEPGQQERLLNKVYGKVLDVNRFIDDLFELSRSQGAQIPYVLELVMFQDWIEDLFQEVAADIEYAGRRCKVAISSNGADADVQIDPHLMKRVILNLVQNACAYTPAGGTITLHASLGIRSVAVRIGDDGPGIGPERLPHIFRRNYKEAESQGSGLGLAIAKEIVEGHGGEIGVQSLPGQGSQFYFTLPVVDTT